MSPYVRFATFHIYKFYDFVLDILGQVIIFMVCISSFNTNTVVMLQYFYCDMNALFK